MPTAADRTGMFLNSPTRGRDHDPPSSFIFRLRVGTAGSTTREGNNDSPPSFVIFVTGFGGLGSDAGGQQRWPCRVLSFSSPDMGAPFFTLGNSARRVTGIKRSSEAAWTGRRRLAVAVGLPGVA